MGEEGTGDVVRVLLEADVIEADLCKDDGEDFARLGPRVEIAIGTGVAFGVGAGRGCGSTIRGGLTVIG